MKENRRGLRGCLTPAEAELWKHLKNGSLEGRKFRQQHSIGNYIADFYCPSEQLAIELDGQVHMNSVAVQVDHERDQYMRRLNIKVLRFENKDVFENLRAVLQVISGCFSK